jgi:hypothetical protein
MSATDIPPAQGIALAWLQCGRPRASAAEAVTTRVTVLKAVNASGPTRYFRRALNPGRAMDIGSSSGTRFISLSASSYST